MPLQPREHICTFPPSRRERGRVEGGREEERKCVSNLACIYRSSHHQIAAVQSGPPLIPAYLSRLQRIERSVWRQTAWAPGQGYSRWGWCPTSGSLPGKHRKGGEKKHTHSTQTTEKQVRKTGGQTGLRGGFIFQCARQTSAAAKTSPICPWPWKILEFARVDLLPASHGKRNL